jgi:hypothetical protein
MKTSDQLHDPATFLRRKKSETNCIGGWMDPRGERDAVEKTGFCPYLELNPDFSVIKYIAQP